MDELQQRIERETRRRTAAVRDMLLEQGRPDLAAELDRNMRDIALGLTEARNCWHSISLAQRRALAFTNEWGGALVRQHNNYHSERGSPLWPIRVATVRNLCARELLAWDGGLPDPERKAVITERGLFVLRHGQGQ